MLLTDTNILQRICLGQAMKHVERLRRRGIQLATTAHNIVELRHNVAKLGLSSEDMVIEVDDVLAVFDQLRPDEYAHLESSADARLRQGGKSDWPLLAAAMAVRGEIWSEDTDFFGTGVPVWTTVNLRFVERIADA